MKILSNAHMHTTFCDGKNTPEEMVLAGLERGFISMGFSIHGYVPYDASNPSMENEALYKAELTRLRGVYGDRVEILIGVERDALGERAYEGFDYLIDSTHFLEKDGELLFVDYSEARMDEAVKKHFGGDYYAYAKYYYDRVAKVCAESTATFIGHIDLVTKYNEVTARLDEEDPRYLDPALNAVACALDRNIPLEMNTGAISRGYRKTPYPAIPILKYIRQRGGEIIINSDAHSAAGIDCEFDKCIDIARSCGFDHVLRLRAKGFEEVGIL